MSSESKKESKITLIINNSDGTGEVHHAKFFKGVLIPEPEIEDKSVVVVRAFEAGDATERERSTANMILIKEADTTGSLLREMLAGDKAIVTPVAVLRGIL